MKISDYIEWLKELPPDTEIDQIGSEKSLRGDLIIIQWQAGTLTGGAIDNLSEILDRDKIHAVLIEYHPGRGPVEFWAIKK